MDEPAIDGGEPVREETLPYGFHWLDDDDIEAVKEVLEDGWITQGPKIDEFEETVCDYTGTSFGVASNSGTSALHSALYAAGVESGDEVITSPMTFAATSNAVLFCNGRPVFADIDPETWNIDPEKVKEKITDKTKAIVPVHFAGQPCNMDALMEIAEDNDLLIVEDAAHALGAEYDERKIGSIGDMTAFSFHPVKAVTTAEGGMVVTDGEEFHDRCKLIRNHGLSTEVRERGEGEEPWKYEMVDLGWNYRISDIHASLGISQMKKLDEFIQRRNEIANAYEEAFEGMNSLETQKVLPDVRHARHIYPISLNLDELSEGRTEIFNALRAENIGVNVHYIPVHYHPYYRDMGFEPGDFPVTEDLYESLITLPIFPKMTDEDVQDVIKAIRKVLSQ